MGVVVINHNRQEDECWEVKVDMVDQCSKAPSSVNVKITPLVHQKIKFLMDKFKSIEWLGYLIGDKEKMLVEDIIIPKQRVSSTRVDEVECSEYNELNIIGVIHSHHNMSAKFSGTDDEFINGNHDISILVAKSGSGLKFESQVRWKTPCGALRIVKGSVDIYFPVEFDSEAFEKDVDEKIKKETFPPAAGVGYSYGFNGNYYNGGSYYNNANRRWHHGNKYSGDNREEKNINALSSFIKKKEEDVVKQLEALTKETKNLAKSIISDVV